MIIDAKDLIIGRLGTVVAKKALLGERIDIINSGEAVITGSKKDILEKYKARRDRGEPQSGPFLPLQEDRFLKRTIRGMLPYKQEKGLSAFKRIKCYKGVPESLKEQKAESIERAHIKKVPNLKYMKIKELCKILGNNS